jgi:predicted DNA-binding transcriptional regulator AlpA
MTRSYLSDQREEDELLHPGEVRKKLKVGDKTLYRYRRDDLLHPIVLNSRTYRYRKSEINRLIQQADSAAHTKKCPAALAKAALAP